MPDSPRERHLGPLLCGFRAAVANRRHFRDAPGRYRWTRGHISGQRRTGTRAAGPNSKVTNHDARTWRGARRRRCATPVQGAISVSSAPDFGPQTIPWPRT